MAARDAEGTTGRVGSGALVELLAQLVDLLESVRESNAVRDTIADLLERIENDPDAVPPEMREIVRRYFELLR